MVLGALLGLSGAIGAASMGLQHGFNRNAANQQYKYQRQLNLQQYDLQSRLNQQQQDFARENSLLDYDRTRELTQDSWKLNKLGMMQAGINPAFKDGSNAVANSNPTASPSAGSAQGGSAPTVQPVDAIRTIDNGVGNFLLAQKQSSEIELTKQQAENVRQDNLTKLQRDLADLAGKKANAKNDEERAQLSKLERVLKSRLFENEYQALLAETNSRKTKATVDAKIYEDMQMQELTNKRAEYLQIVENTNLTKKERAKAAAEIREIDARIRKLDAETEGQKLENKFNEDTMPDREEGVKKDNQLKDDKHSEYTLNNSYLSQTLSDRVKAVGLDNVIKRVEGMPKSYKDIILRSHQWQVMVYKLEHNQPLTDQETKNLESLLELDHYDPQRDKDRIVQLVGLFRK